jgi:hypothetical protein
MIVGYEFSRADLPTLLKVRYYPEIPRPESEVLGDFLEAHGEDYDRFVFSARVGEGLTPDPTHLPGVQRSTVYSTRKRIDLLLWSGVQPTIVEAKERITASAVGQLLMYRQEFRKEMPDALDPSLVVIGRSSDPITLELVTANGIDWFIYEPTEVGR